MQAKDTWMKKIEHMLRLSFIVLQDLLVDCFKPTEVSFLLPSIPLLHSHIDAVFIFYILNPLHEFCPFCLPVGLHLRAARQDSRDAEALHASEEMMAPPSLLPLHLSPLPSSSYRAFHPFVLMSVFFDWRSSLKSSNWTLSLGPLFHLFCSFCLDPAP